MRRWVFILGLTLLPAANADRARAEFRAGAASANVTPPLGEPIVGGWASPPATFVHDELHARCLVLDDGATTLAFVVVDSVGVARGVFDRARKLVREETGLPEANLLLAATHTHSATSSQFPNPLAPDDTLTDYQRFLARRVADAVRLARHNLAPAEVAWGAADVSEHVFNRRWFLKPGTPLPNPLGGEDKVRMNPAPASPELVEPAGPVDPQVTFLAVRSPNAAPIALLANYSLHYVGGVPEGHVSADYFGAFADRLAKQLQGDAPDPPFVGILTNGTSGDVNNIDFLHKTAPLPPYQKMRLVANDVAGAVLNALRAAPYRRDVTLAAARTDLALATRRPTAEQVAFARSVLGRPAGEKPRHPHERVYAERVLQLHDSPAEIAVPLQAFRVGDLGVAAIPFEVFAETGLAIKKASPLSPTFTIELANGAYGYLPTPKQHALGGYETWLGTSRVEVGASDKIERAVLDLLRGLKADRP